jgi:hypothetical protein
MDYSVLARVDLQPGTMVVIETDSQAQQWARPLDPENGRDGAEQPVGVVLVFAARGTRVQIAKRGATRFVPQEG